VYEHYDELELSPPAGATTATIELLYQPTSWEYIQFLALANDGTNALLGDTGELMLEAWLATGMAEPVVMASATWTGDGGVLGDSFCFCDAGPCGNDDPLAGCANSTGSGATLMATGSASVSADDLGFTSANLLPGEPALLFVGDQRVQGGSGKPFGDGLRCATGAVALLGLARAQPDGSASWGPGLATHFGWSAGELLRFQASYRDPASPCGSGLNLTHGLELLVEP
jgi:hypothetical protein